MSTASDEKKPATHVTIKVQDQKDKCVYFRVKKDVALRNMMEAFCIKTGIEMSTIKFLFDGIMISPHQTPTELELIDEDKIDAWRWREQIGG